MLKTITQAVVDGYGAGQTDLVERLAEGDPMMKQAFFENIVLPLVEVLQSSEETAVLKVEGHSDRDDRPGLTREQRRRSELDASVARANNATDRAFEVVTFELPGRVPALDWAEVQQVAVMPVAVGAAQLIESSESPSEAQQRRNRRVVFVLARFQHSLHPSVPIG